MGQARRNIDMDAAGIPRPRSTLCPACGSNAIVVVARPDVPENLRRLMSADYQFCCDCGAMWEPFPETYARDPVCAAPCDNCAFRPGSPEQQDKAGWKSLMASLKPQDDGKWGRFYCHKGVPLDQARPGNFLFPRRPVLIDGKPLRKADGTFATVEDTTRMRVCSGYLRMMWSINDVDTPWKSNPYAHQRHPRR